MNEPFLNPYITGDNKGEATLNLQSNVGVTDYQYIKNLALRSGVLDRTVAILWKKLCQRCREAGFDNFTSEQQYYNYVNNLSLPSVASVLEPAVATAPNTGRKRRTAKGAVPETVG